MKVNLLTRWCWRGASVAPSQDDDSVNHPGSRNGNRLTSNGPHETLDVQDNPSARSNRRCSECTLYRFKSQWRTILTTVGVATLIGVVAYFCRDYVRKILLWMDAQELWVVILVFLALFTVVSFPFTWGYIVINIAAGYMFGTWKGLGLTFGTVTLAVTLVHTIIRGCLREFVRKQVLRSPIVSALLAVLAGSHAFKVIVVARLTPIPFGLQNAAFAVSSVPTLLYMTATIIGLLPTQLLNCYLGTTVRNLQDVVTESSNATATGWIIFSVQIAISIALTVWVVRRAKAELQKTMTAELSHPNSASPSCPRASSPGNIDVPVVAQNQNRIANVATLMPTSPCRTILQINGILNQKATHQEQQDQQHLPNSPSSQQCMPLALQTPTKATYPPQNMRRLSSSHLSCLAMTSDRFFDNPVRLTPSKNLKWPFSPKDDDDDNDDDDDPHCKITICEEERLIPDDNNERRRPSNIISTFPEAGALRIDSSLSTTRPISLGQEDSCRCYAAERKWRSCQDSSSDDELILLGSMEQIRNPA
ncbi:uncharacterized protein [Palaemon carinicauda]|uniref:uncharacterized protein n=1 Tax=Palaemon carinicauda TaxID=392227 RepID=UPI0035B5F556